jgi:hypothetical protein
MRTLFHAQLALASAKTTKLELARRPLRSTPSTVRCTAVGPQRILGALLGGGPVAGRLLGALLATPTVPLGSYVEPPRLLHRLDARVKQAWLLALLLLPGQLCLPAKLCCVLLVAAATAATLPTRDAAEQLGALSALCLLLFALTALGADGCAPLRWRSCAR